MFNIFLLLLLSMMLSLFMIMMNLYFSKKIFMSREKKSSFECGFDSMLTSRIPFSIQFFLLSLLFLIFDIEITLLIPFTFLFNLINPFPIFSMLIFMLMMIISIYMEYMENILEWK